MRFLAAMLASCALLGSPAVTSGQPPAAQAALRAQLAAKAPLLALAHAGQRIVAVGDYGIVVLSDDGGRTWRQASSVATRNMLTAVAFADAKLGWAVGHGGTVMHTNDGGENWALIHSAGNDVALLSVWFENARRGIAVGAFGFAIETRDGGRTWKPLTVGEGDDRDRHLNSVFAFPGGPLFIAAEAGTVFRSVDDARSWTTLRLPYNGSMWGGMPLSDGAAIVFGMRGHVLRSADHGKTWSDVRTGTEQSFSGGVQLADGTVVVVGLGGAIARSRDGGRNFDTAVHAEREVYAAVAAGPDGQLVVAGQGGIALVPLAAN